jgi:DNA-binding transcriptional MocR family regulator
LTREINCKPEQILLTFGANYALDLIIRRFLVANDTVLVDDPGYYPLFAKLKLAQVNIEVAELGARESIFIAPRTVFFA